MPIPVVCPGCSAKLNAPDGAAGKKVKCPKCAGAITIPAPAASADFEVVEDEPAPPPKKPAPAPAAPAKKPVKAVVEEDDDEDEKPKKKPAKAIVEVDDDEEEEKPKKKAKAVVEDDEDDEKPKKKKPKAVVEADDDEDDKPRKKKRAAADDEDDEDEDRPKKKKKKRKDDEEEPSSLVRNIIGGVVLIILLVVLFFVFKPHLFPSDDDKKTSENKSNTDGGNPLGPGPNGPGPNPPGPVNDGRSWQVKASTDGRYRLSFPDSPRSGADWLKQEVVAGEISISSGGEKGAGAQKELYYGGHIIYPDGTKEGDKGLIKAGVSESLGNVVLTDKVAQKVLRRQITFAGNRWDEVQRSVDGPGGMKGGITLRMLDAGDRMYVLMVGRPDEFPPADVQKRFFESFELLK